MTSSPAPLRLTSCVLIEAHDEWQVSDRRYLAESLDGPAQPDRPTVLEPRRDNDSEVIDAPALQTA